MDALVIDSFKVVTTYRAGAWQRVLEDFNLTSRYPNLVHDIRYGSPIGNPPHLFKTFIPNNNMPSAIDHSDVIDKYISDEIVAGSVTGGLSIEDAHTFFGGHFRTAPMGVVEQNNKFRTAHNLSALDSDGYSTNSFLDPKYTRIAWHGAATMADKVSLFPFWKSYMLLFLLSDHLCSFLILEDLWSSSCLRTLFYLILLRSCVILVFEESSFPFMFEGFCYSPV